jgi:LysR family nitrogen assimilation transcriptional regulator
MDLKQIQYFLQIARLRSFNRAASHLYVAQSALSRQVRLLEEELGTPLFRRHARGVQLTRAGEKLLERGELLLRFSRQLRDEVTAEGAEPRGEVIIGLPPSLQDVLAVPLLMSMRQRYPGIQLTAWIGTSMILKEMLDAGSLDLAVIGALDTEADMAAHPLFRDALCLVGAPGSALPRGPITCSQLADLPLILTSRPNSMRRLVEIAAAKVKVKLNVIMEVNYVPLILELVRRGLGHTLLPLPAVEQRVAARELEVIRVTGLSYDWAMALPKDSPGSVGTNCVEQLLFEITRQRFGSAAFARKARGQAKRRPRTPRPSI